MIPLVFRPWVGPFLGMAEDCNKKGGRVVGDRGELSCAEVEIVKRLRHSGRNAAWFQTWRCGRRRWSDYIQDRPSLPKRVQRLQDIIGSGGGHPDVIAWWNDRVVFVESKGPGDTLKPNQIEWFTRAVHAGLGAEDLAIAEWTSIAPT